MTLAIPGFVMTTPTSMYSCSVVEGLPGDGDKSAMNAGGGDALRADNCNDAYLGWQEDEIDAAREASLPEAEENDGGNNQDEHTPETPIDHDHSGEILTASRYLGETSFDLASESPADEKPSGERQPTDDFDWSAPKHVFVLSSAGKPVFSLFGDEQHLSTLMGLIQGLLSLCADCGDDEESDEMESICAGNRRFVFLRRGDLVLVAVSSSYAGRSATRSGLSLDIAEEGEGAAGVRRARPMRDDSGGYRLESTAFLRLQLEYIYSSILFLLTSKVQAVFRRSPGYDLRGLLGGADSSLKGVIDLAEPSRGRGRMLAGGVETVWIDPAIRARVTSALQGAQSAAAPSALYAIWLCGEELVALAQPRAPSHRLHSQDLLLLVNFIATQPALRNAESWTPICFPRFQEQGYLYAYTAFLDDPERTNGDSSRHDDDYDRNEQSSTLRMAPGDGHVDSSRGKLSHLRGGQNLTTRTAESCIILVSAEASADQFQAFRRARMALEARFHLALGANWDRYLGSGARIEREAILSKFCSQLNAIHFFYCLRGRRGGAPCVNQVLSPPFAPALTNDHASQRRIWGHYIRAALRLRRGSSQEGRVFCRDENIEEWNPMKDGIDGAGGAGADSDASAVAEATAIFEADPVHSLAYEICATETVVSLFGQRDGGSGGSRWSGSSGGRGSGGRNWGERDELHACFSSAVVPVGAAYKAAVRLVAIIRRDREWLFLTGTGTLK